LQNIIQQHIASLSEHTKGLSFMKKKKNTDEGGIYISRSGAAICAAVEVAQHNGR
jgi:hypothetical protein